jgi:pyruvate kinase
MLSEETAAGGHPVEAVKVMARIAKTVEAEIAQTHPLRDPFPQDDPIPDSISYSAYLMAEKLAIRAIVTPTRSGATARLISRYRPDPPIIALTPSDVAARRLCLTWGAFPVITPDLNGTDITEKAMAWAKKTLPLKKGDRVIVTAGTMAAGSTNTIRLEQV